jgi:hypothetical protein
MREIYIVHLFLCFPRGPRSQNRYTKKPRQHPLPPQFDPLQLRPAVALITVRLLTLLILLHLFMGWWKIFVIMKILFFGNCCERLDVKKIFQNRKM